MSFCGKKSYMDYDCPSETVPEKFLFAHYADLNNYNEVQHILESVYWKVLVKYLANLRQKIYFLCPRWWDMGILENVVKSFS